MFETRNNPKVLLWRISS